MTKLPQFPVEGGCTCGAVRYRLNSAPKAVYRCHCKDCQRFSNTSHTISMVCTEDQVEHLSGEIDYWQKTADSGNGIRMWACKECGTKLWNEPLAAPGARIMKAGNLDDASWARPIGNIWTSSAVAWETINPDEPNFEQQPTDRAPLMEAWAKAHSA